MEIFEEIMFYRGVERILIIVFSGISLILGWNLFKSGIHPDQNAVIKTGGLFIKLSKVGPGIFFALFGSAVFVYSLSSPIQYVEKNEEDNKGSSVNVSYLTSDQEKYLELSKSINTLQNISVIYNEGNMTDIDYSLFNSAVYNLEQERASWIVATFGLENYKQWEKNGDSFLINPENVSGEYRAVFEDMRHWMSDTLIDK